ncbi:MAG: aspartate aminotransferase family protein [Planctomycetota bacterium]|nr:MAG: aspartate aminotransferase family protein [Planctomycetota bacterium]
MCYSLPAASRDPQPYTGPAKREVLAGRQQFLSPALLMYYRQPVMLVEAEMQYVWDETGKRYLDAFAGIASVSVGHCHPHVVDAIREQAEKILHTSCIYLHPKMISFAKKLAGTFPADSDLQVSYFTNSGSESNDLAVLMCRLYTKRFDVIALRNGYHGGSQATMALTAMNTWKHQVPHSFGVHFAIPGYCYRCPLGLSYPSCGVKCAKDVAEVIRYETPGEIACFIAEPIQGVGGVVVPPPEYFQIIYDQVRKAGGLCISDEVQAGLGRTGECFWAFENWGVKPDMVTVAKGIGNGVTLGAITTRMKVAERLTDSLHFNTFGGNPVSMSAGLATFEAIEADQTQKNTERLGGYIKSKLIELQNRHPLIGDVRGMGLLLGIELVKDRETKEPATSEAADVTETAKDRGLLLGRSGIDSNIIRITPPMCITRDDADFIIDCLDDVIARAEKHVNNSN